MIATYYAATGKLADLTLDDLENQATRDFAAGVEKSVSHYAPTVGSFLDYLATAEDPYGYISALAVEEQEVVHYNRGGHSGGQLPRVPLQAIYPSNGTLAADHPFVLLHSPWVGPAKQKLATAFLAWLLVEHQQKKFFDAGFRDQLGNAHDTLANDEGVSANRPTFLDPPDPAVVAAIQKKWQEIRKSARILIVLALADASQREYVREGVNALSEKDEVAVWALIRGKTLPILRPTSLDEPGRAQVLRAIGSAPTARGEVPLYATIRDGYRFLKEQFEPARINAIVVIAANSDDGSGPSVIVLQREVRTEPTKPPIRIYSVALKGSSRSQLETIERASGGVASSSDDPGDAIRTALANF
jgi:Ca-activated chloride channel family protein